MIEAGMPPDIVQWVPGDPEMVTRVCLDHEDLAGISFTGSTQVSKELLAKVGGNTDKNVYRQYHRMVGETGGRELPSNSQECEY
jgi:1-pyrroline-5-carboxylate dehydrogenase